MSKIKIKKKLEIENNQININNKKEEDEEDKKEDNIIHFRKRTVVDIEPKFSTEKFLGITNENNEEIKGRKRNKTLKATNISSHSALGKKH